MEKSTLKVRIAVLWILMAVAMSAHSVLYFMEDGTIALIESGDIWVGMDALLRVDAPEHPMAERFISLVTETLQSPAERPAVAATSD